MGFRSVFGAAVVVQVDRGGGSFGDGDDVIVVAAVGWGGADRVGAGAVAEVDGVAEFAERESAPSPATKSSGAIEHRDRV